MSDPYPRHATDEPFLVIEAGWTGVFTRREAKGAIPNGTRVVMVETEPGGTVPLGSTGTVLGSLEFPPGAVEEERDRIIAAGLDPRPVKYAYFVEWDHLPRHAVGIMDWKIGRADAG